MNLSLLVIFVCFWDIINARSNFRTYTENDLLILRDRVSAMFHHAYDSYLRYAYPYDELKPLSCEGFDTWGSYSLTLIDALDTLAIMGNYTEFRRVYNLLAETRTSFDSNINVSVFETNIRVVGGLLSAHLLAKKANVDLEPGWPCNGPLLRLAEDAATRLLPAFDTATGMPYGTVNLRYGVPDGETPVTCTAGVGTFIIEFGTLSRLTGNVVFEKTALRALDALWSLRSPIGLLGNHVDVQTGKWTATDAGIGAGVDSYYEYLVKGSILFQRPELMHMFKESRVAIDQFLKHDDWHFWVTMKHGTVTMPIFQSLEAFWPGILSLIGDNIAGLKSIHNYHQIWKQYGFLPEFYNVAQNVATSKREGYPLRPELVESAMYLYRATRDPFLINLGEDMLVSIEHSAKTACGYATIKDVRDHTLEDRMESFFLAETTKYLYLLFDTNNFIHNSGIEATAIQTPRGSCVIDAGGYIFNTEAHPIDPSVLDCCSGPKEEDLIDHFKDILRGNFLVEFKGDSVSTRLEEIETRRREEARRRKERELELQKLLMDKLQKERDLVRRKRELEELRRKKQILESIEGQSSGEGHGEAILVNRDPVVSLEAENLEIESEIESRSQSTGDQNHGDEIVLANVKKIEPERNFESVGPVVISDVTVAENDEKQTLDFEQDGKPADDAEAATPDALTPDEHDAIPNPHFTASESDPIQIEKSNTPLLIKKLSKDEVTESLNTEAEERSPKDNLDLLEALNSVIKHYLPSTKKAFGKFDLDDFRERMYTDNKYSLCNNTWYTDHSVMVCPSKHFLERFSIQGEFFDKYD